MWLLIVLILLYTDFGNSLAVQQLWLGPLTAGALGSILGQRTKILQTTWHGQNKTKQKSNQKKHTDLKKHMTPTTMFSLISC